MRGGPLALVLLAGAGTAGSGGDTEDTDVDSDSDADADVDSDVDAMRTLTLTPTRTPTPTPTAARTSTRQGCRDLHLRAHRGRPLQACPSMSMTWGGAARCCSAVLSRTHAGLIEGGAPLKATLDLSATTITGTLTASGVVVAEFDGHKLVITGDCP
jgi:hypothetical protein